LREELKYIFSNVNDWLKFAEAKHGGLILLNSAIIIGVISVLPDSKLFDSYSAAASLAICGCSILISLASQFPTTSNLLIGASNKANPNIYFFEDLSKMSLDGFLLEYRRSYPDFKPTASDENLVNQILVNSRIATSKFRTFKICCYVSIFGIGLLGLSLLMRVLLVTTSL